MILLIGHGCSCFFAVPSHDTLLAGEGSVYLEKKLFGRNKLSCVSNVA